MAAPMKERVCGWINKLEWEHVYRELYSNDVISQHNAVDKIRVWRSRLNHRMSTALECSCELMQAKLLKNHAEVHQNLSCQEDGIRLSYSLALIRFINLLTEKSQTRLYAQPVHLLAKELGLPEWLVNLRHEASHTSLPSLSMLEDAAEFALLWLRKNYWEAQLVPSDVYEEEEEDTHAHSSCEFKSHLADVLYRYMQYSFRDMDNQDSPKKERQDLLRKFREIVRERKPDVITMLVEDGYLMATSEQLEALEVTIEVTAVDERMALPVPLIQLWKPVIECLIELHCVALLLETLIHELREETSLRQRLIAGWILIILQSKPSNNSANCSPVNYSVLADLFKTPFKFDKEKILCGILDSPNCYTTKILQFLFPTMNGKLSEDQQGQLKVLLEMYTIPKVDVLAETGGHIDYQISDFLEVKNNGLAGVDGEQTDEMKIMETNDENNVSRSAAKGWQIADKFVPWRDFPLGSCPSYRDGNYLSLTYAKS